VPAVPAALVALRRSLARSLLLAGPDAGAAVYDLSGRTWLLTLRDGVKRPPASVEKLFTSIAVLRKLGPDAELQTTVLGTGQLGAGGVWHGDLYLRGGGDPTFGDGAFNRTWELGYGPAASELAGQLEAAGIRRVTGALIGDPSLFDARPGGPATAFAADIPDLGGELSALTYDHGATSGSLTPGAFAVRQLALTLRASHVKVRAAPLTGVTPPNARKLASVSSPPLAVLLRLMDVPSDDLFAELLTKQLGARFGGAGSISAGARVTAAEIASDYNLHPAIVDGSGLSRANRASPLEVVDLLRYTWRTPVGNVLWSALPVVGVSGTVRGIATGTPAQGRCIAKTGTLDYVTNLAGYCHTQRGHVVAFALFIDGPSNSRAVVLLSRMVAALARY
jgi:D-alanyl-D-alanine carboxypeptidase/D-alanyl-D-alanine-endopeptidase (penicillin-binding protein 4)